MRTRRIARLAWHGARIAAGAAAVTRIARGADRRPPLTPGAPAPPGTVSVIVPARDEERRLGACLDGLAGAGAHEVIVVDDRSTDATATIARAAGARVVDGSPLPDRWAGKCWALQQGLAAATGDWVVCLDADTRPRPGLLAAAVTEAEQGGWDLLTLGARFDCGTTGERVLHPSMLATLLYRFGPPGTRSLPPAERTVANGQCMVARRAAWSAWGGMGPVAGSLVEDVALARHLAHRGRRVGFLDGTALLDVDMHDDAADAWRSWGRSLPLAEITPPATMAADLGVVWLAQALPLLRVAAGRGDVLDLALLALRVGVVAATAGAYRDAGPAHWLSPLADLPVAARLTQATVRPERTWRGRTY
jgi:dolichol-phosphate mannosyltransferase